MKKIAKISIICFLACFLVSCSNSDNGTKVKNGDVVNINFSTFVDNKELSGYSVSSLSVVLGSNQLSSIPNYEEQILGMTEGKTKDIQVTFPADYADEQLKGKTATLKTTVNFIYEKVEGTDVAVKNNDLVMIDFAGTIKGKAFEGGTASNYPIIIGSNTFIEGYEVAMIGMKIGETKDIKLKFPKTYHSEELAGKNVVFKTTIVELYAAPDETAK